MHDRQRAGVIAVGMRHQEGVQSFPGNGSGSGSGRVVDSRNQDLLPAAKLAPIGRRELDMEREVGSRGDSEKRKPLVKVVVPADRLASLMQKESRPPRFAALSASRRAPRTRWNGVM